MSGQGTSTIQVSRARPPAGRCLGLTRGKFAKKVVSLVHKSAHLALWFAGGRSLDHTILLISSLLHTQGASKPSSWSTQRPGGR